MNFAMHSFTLEPLKSFVAAPKLNVQTLTMRIPMKIEKEKKFVYFLSSTGWETLFLIKQKHFLLPRFNVQYCSLFSYLFLKIFFCSFKCMWSTKWDSSLVLESFKSDTLLDIIYALIDLAFGAHLALQ